MNTKLHQCGSSGSQDIQNVMILSGEICIEIKAFTCAHAIAKVHIWSIVHKIASGQHFTVFITCENNEKKVIFENNQKQNKAKCYHA